MDGDGNKTAAHARLLLVFKGSNCSEEQNNADSPSASFTIHTLFVVTLKHC